MKDTITLPRKLVQDAVDSLQGYRRELWDTQPCDTEKALQAALDAPVVKAEPPKPIFSIAIAERKWRSLQDDGYTMKHIAFEGKGKAGTIDAWGKVLWTEWPKPTEDPMLACDIAPRPLEYPLSHYHLAIGGGPLHFTWKDKPHRLVYDLIAAVKYYAQQAAPTPEPQPDKGCMTCRHGDSDGFPACPARGAGCYMGADGYGSNWEPLNSDSKPLKSYGLQGVHDAITEDPSLCDPEPKPLEGDDLHIAYMVGFNKGKQDGIKEPQRVPLTEEQIFDLAGNYDCGTREENERWIFTSPKQLLHFVRSIEAASIKEGS